MPFLYVYSPSDFTVTPPTESGAAANGTPTFTLTLIAGATPTLIEVADDELVFDEVDGTQNLTSAVNLDGTSYAAGTTINTAYDLINTTTGHKVTSLHFGGDGYQQGAIDGLVSTVLMTPGTTYTFDSERTSHQQNNQYTDYVACFTQGALIETPTGQTLIDDLSVGDLVMTLDDGPQPLRAVLSRTVSATGAFAPIALPKGSCNNQRDLLVSPQHRMLCDGPRCELLFGEGEVLVSAKQMLEAGIGHRREGGEVTYIHLIFDDHQIIFAEGAATESFLPSDSAHLPAATRDEFDALFPNQRYAPAHTTARMCLRGHEAHLLMAA